jgi:hypothetical protein
MMAEPILAGLQTAIDRDVNGAGWTVAHYAAVVGLQRLTADGQIETTIALYYADGQADYTTEGLLVQGDRLRAQVYEERDNQ